MNSVNCVETSLHHSPTTTFTVSLCILNQWALDFTGNTSRIIQSIKLSKQAGARYRLGPELELSSYGCQDHFHELDTYTHSWQCLAEILKETNINPDLQDVVCDIGMPVLHGGVAYNCRTLILNGRVLLIRPKLVLADSGLHRESRWFTPWPHHCQLVDFILPPYVRQVSRDAQRTAPFGDAILRFSGNDYSDSVQIGLETCEELWIGAPPHIQMYASGADAVLNASASHHELRKLSRRMDLVKMASLANGGGLYAYTNLKGCDSERTCYDGGAMAAICGQMVLLTQQFGFDEIEIQTVTADLNFIRSKRIADRCFGRAAAASAAASSSALSGVSTQAYPIIDVNFSMCQTSPPNSASLQQPKLNQICPEDEIPKGPALWLWDMLRRSRSSGLFLCLSGGLDSASVACICFSMCHGIYEAINQGNQSVLNDCRRILGENDQYTPKSPQDLCSRLFTTCYLPSENSSAETRSRAKRLAKAIGSNHIESEISTIVNDFVRAASTSLNLDKPPCFTVNGGTDRESLALQNVQARSRLVLAYLLAQLLPWQKSLPGGLLVLSSANLDESLRGYLTKYDNSSADLNPIGSISKLDIRRFVAYWAKTQSSTSDLSAVIDEILLAPPTAELLPLQPDGQVQQTDETEMGLTYDELSLFGRLRKNASCGPYSMLLTLLEGEWLQIKAQLPSQCLNADGTAGPLLAKYLASKIKHFFRTYAINRHKATILPPAYHADTYSADDNRFDLRPFLYPTDWSHQFQCVDSLVLKWEDQYAQNRS